jgi:dTDP-3-amino-3,4,6-trideoxy-alpha-D-glucose transaminase
MTNQRVNWIDLRPQEDAEDVAVAIRRVVDRGWFVLGPEVEGFEAEFSDATSSQHTVSLASGTDALTLTLRALGIGSGDEVITTALSAAFTAQAIMMAGARPVFADIDPDRLTVDPAAVEALVGPSTAAIMPVHLYGQPADIPALARVADRHGLALIEDCCQAHLATCQGVPIGTTGIAAAYSFYPTKNLGAFGDGGAVCTRDAALDTRLRRLRNGGQTTRNHHTEAAAHSRLDEMQAAVLRARLPYLAGWTTRRRALAAQYRAGLTGTTDTTVVVPPACDPGHVYHLFPLRTAARDGLRKHLHAHGIDTLIHYPTPLQNQPAFADAGPNHCPVATSICDELLSVPLYPGLTDAAVTRVVDAVTVVSAARQHRIIV